MSGAGCGGGPAPRPAGQGRAGSWTAHLLAEDDRRARAARAAAAPFAATAGTVRSSIRSALDVPLQPAFEDRDAREDEPWFTALQQAERERLAGVWNRKRHAFDGLPALRWRSRAESVCVAVAVFAVIGVLQSPLFGLGHVAAMLLLGVLAGAGWSLRPDSRALCAASSGAAYLAGCFPTMWDCGRNGNAIGLVAFFCGLWLCVNLSALAGMDREARVRGGFEYC